MHSLLILAPEHRGKGWEGSDGGIEEREKGMRRKREQEWIAAGG